MSSKYRSDEKITKEILEIASAGNVTKTAIQGKAVLEYHACIKRIDELMQKGLLSVDGFGKLYTTTEKGREWLRRYNSLNEVSIPLVC